MKLPSMRLMAFNAAAAIFFVGAVLSVFLDFLIPPQMPPCSPRYLATTGFALELDGRLLTAIDLQAAAAGRDRGVTENAVVERVSDAPARQALMVRLAHAGGSIGGLSFPWLPRSVKTLTAACLAYDVRLPADFDFGAGGTLPGMIGAADQTTLMSDGPDGFALPVQWGEHGSTAMQAKTRLETRLSIADFGGGRSGLPRGRWVRIEQEAVLNTPGAADGIVRLWIDGKLKVERTDLVLRASDAISIAGVATDVYHGQPDMPGAAPRDQELQLTPLELRAK